GHGDARRGAALRAEAAHVLGQRLAEERLRAVAISSREPDLPDLEQRIAGPTLEVAVVAPPPLGEVRVGPLGGIEVPLRRDEHGAEREAPEETRVLGPEARLEDPERLVERGLRLFEPLLPREAAAELRERLSHGGVVGSEEVGLDGHRLPELG